MVSYFALDEFYCYMLRATGWMFNVYFVGSFEVWLAARFGRYADFCFSLRSLEL